MQRLRAPIDSCEHMLEVVAELLAGKVLDGRYLLERLIRSDPFGFFYEALDLEQRAVVQVRVVATLRPPGAGVMSHPNHFPHAAEILELGVSQLRLPYAVLEPLSGETISTRLLRGREITLSDALEWSLAAALALTGAHAAGRAHGHLCASSLFLHLADTDSQSIRILGFEIGALGPPRGMTMNVLASEVGDFFAPEVQAGAAPTPAADVYSLAMLLGTLFGSSLPPCTSECPPNTWALQRLPPYLAELAGTALSANPEQRPEARAFARAIERLGPPHV